MDSAKKRKRKIISTEEKDSEISCPCEEFRIWFCGEVPSGSVAWYFIDVSEKTESSTKKLYPFLVSEHFPSVYYAFLKGCIYFLGGQRSLGDQRSGKTLLNDVWILDIKSLDSFAARGEEKLKGPEKPHERLKLNWPKLEPRLKLEPSILQSMPESMREIMQSMPERVREIMRESIRESMPESMREIMRESMRESMPESMPEQRMFHALPLREPRAPVVRGPPMAFARCNPHTMVVDQKLYVLGGFEPNQNQADGWIEVFDPVVGKWESLPSPPDQIHSTVMISGLLKAKKEIIIAKQRWDRHPMIFYSYNIMTRCWKPLATPASEASVHLPPNAGRAVTVGNTLYWISTEEHNRECIIRAYDLDRNIWFEEHLNTAAIFGSCGIQEHFSSIYSSGPGFLHLRDQKFCLLLQSSITKNYPQSSIEYLYCVILEISPIYELEGRGRFELTIVSFQKYSMDQYIDFLDCMLE